jgi:UDP-3-O-[3-hydroxymyristoyl] glucosamine N-acyltransferase
MFSPQDYLDLNHTEHRMLFENAANVWDALKQISSYMQFRLKPAVRGKLIGKPFISGAVFIGAGTVIEQGAMIKGPAWIGENCEIRNGCYIRENVIVGNGACSAIRASLKTACFSTRHRFRISATSATRSSAIAATSARA